LNLDELIANAKKANLIFKPKDGALSEARTPSGLHLLWICVEDEKVYNPNSKELYEASLGLSRRLKVARALLPKLERHGGSKSYALQQKL